MHNEVRSAALKYAQNGWPVVLLYGITEAGHCACPLGEKCDSNMQGKHPIPGCGKDDATTDIETIVNWFEQHASIPAINVGVVTGRHSKFVVLDIDPRNGGLESLIELQTEFGSLPVTRTVRTGAGGQHYYFQHPGPNITVRTGTGFLGRGLDIKADKKDDRSAAGGYVVAPPSRHRSGRDYEWVDEELPLAPMPEWLLQLIASTAEKQEAEKKKRFEDVTVVNEGSRHDFLVSIAGKLRHNGLGGKAILSALQAENLARCRPPLPDAEVRAIANDIVGYESPLLRLDDIGNGKRLVNKYGKKIRYCWQQKQWYIWDGRKWAKDTIGQIYQFAKATVESIHDEARDRSGDIGDALKKWAHSSGRVERLNALVACARSEDEIQIRAEKLDSQRLLLNCANGTLELDTGRLRKHSPDDLLTKITEVDFNPTAKSELWNDFINTATEGDKELQDFLQRIAGYALSGLTQEEYIFFVYGPGGTGKSTFFEAIKSVLGDDYCKTASFSTFLRTGPSSPNAPRSDLARLPGARLVTAIEAAEGKQFAADVIKASTGGDKLVVRDLYSSEFEFIPQYKLWLASNSKPRIREDDSGIWRRLLLIPFYHVVEKPNKTLKDAFRYDPHQREAILAWMYEGFRRWQESGLFTPKRVQEETRNYRTEMDPINTWIDDCCIMDDRYTTPFSLLWDSYNNWLKTQPPVVRDTRLESKKAFGLALRQRNLEAETKTVQGRVQRVYKGIGLTI